MKIETRQARRDGTPFTTREDNGERFIEGYFARFDDVYDMGWGVTETVDRHAFDKSLGGDVRFLINHDTGLVLGRTAAGTGEIRVDDTGLWGRVRINPDDTDAVNAWARVSRGDVSGASFGFYIRDIEREYDISKGTVKRTLKDVELYEVSVCTFPAYEKTDLSARDRADGAVREENRIWRERMKARIKKWH